MKNYIYLAEDRINTLYGTLGGVTEYSSGIEAKAQFAGASNTYKYQEATQVPTAKKLEIILKHLSISENLCSDGKYVKGKMPLSWNSVNRIEGNISATFWIGEFEGDKTDPCVCTKILLIGSGHNIVGNNNHTGRYFSTSYIDAFFKYLEDRLDSEKLEFKDGSYGHRASDDLAIIEKIDKSGLTPSDKELLLEKLYKEEWTISRYIDELNESYEGNYCEYEFVAQMQFSQIFLNNNNDPIRYVVAAPLYVSRAKIFGSRTLLLTTGRKYLLTQDEYKAHERNNFRNLHKLLLDENLLEEEAEFTFRMKTLYEEMGGKRLFLSKTAKQTFLDSARPIVNKYFSVLGKIDLSTK